MGAVITDTAGRRDCVHQRLTTPFAFIRFVGNNLHPTDYSRMDDWVERIQEWFDQGLERVKVLGDAYFAVCGHDRPLIDHAPRATAFAVDAQNAVRDLGSATTDGLDTAIGIHTGSVTVGTTGGERVLYDVWGATVSSAHTLARRARPEQILASDDTAVMLPQTVQLDPFGNGDEPIWMVSGTSVGGAV